MIQSRFLVYHHVNYSLELSVVDRMPRYPSQKCWNLYHFTWQKELCSLLALKCREPQARRWERPLAAKTQMTDKKEKRTQSHTARSQQPDNKEVGSSPASRKEHRLTSSLTFCLVTSNLQNDERSPGHCFKSLIL